MEKTDQQPHGGPEATTSEGRDAGIRNSFRKVVGYTTDVWERDYAEIGLVIGPDHMNSLGYVHGGVYATILDAAFGHAVAWCGVPGNMRQTVTTQLTTTYLKGAKEGKLVARGRVLGVDGRIAAVAGEVVGSDGAICATGQATFLYLPGSENPNGIPKPKRSAG